MLASLRDLATRIGQSAGPLLLRGIVPESCAGCGRTGAWICAECADYIEVEVGPGCHRCGRAGRSQRECSRCSRVFPARLVRTRAGFRYSGPLRRAIQRFKYNGEFKRGEDLGARLAERLESTGGYARTRIEFIVPVPLHLRRYRSRGFNQSEILARPVSELLDVPIIEAVERQRNTAPQVRLRANERLENLTRAFAVPEHMREQISGQSILIIDDVMTTGATLAAVSLALQEAGSGNLYGLTLAREQ